VTAPLRISFEVGCSVEHAFSTWTSRISIWWPSDHTVTGDPDRTIVLAEGVGGRIFERTATGEEHDWGVVTRWDPPRHLGYLWHLGGQPAEATEVEITFVDMGGDTTLVEIEHRGWERLGELADAWQDRNRKGWETLLPHFAAAVARGER
jgi:uncharacterized protein YndB with AHSA1/START domain